MYETLGLIYLDLNENLYQKKKLCQRSLISAATKKLVMFQAHLNRTTLLKILQDVSDSSTEV